MAWWRNGDFPRRITGGKGDWSRSPGEMTAAGRDISQTPALYVDREARGRQKAQADQLIKVGNKPREYKNQKKGVRGIDGREV